MRHRFSLRSLLIWPFVLQTIGTVGLVGYLSFRNGQLAVQKLTTQLQDAGMARVEGQLDRFFVEPLGAVQSNAAAATLGQLDLEALQEEDPAEIRSYLLQQLQIFPNIDGLYLASESGAFLCVCGSPEFGVVEKMVQDVPQREQYQLDGAGDRLAFLKADEYDPRTRPWYRNSKRRQVTNWSDIYVFTDGELGITASTPIEDRVNQGADRGLRGVAGADVRLTQISRFLDGIASKISANSQLFIVERSGELVATSQASALLESAPPGSSDIASVRLRGFESDDPVVRATTRSIAQELGAFSQIQATQRFRFQLDRASTPSAPQRQQLNGLERGDRQFVQVFPYGDRFGLDWLIVLVVPESDLMGDIQAHTRTTLQLCGVALVISIGLSILIARLLSEPIQRMSQAVSAISQGDLHQQISGGRTREVGLLAQAFNRMSANLQASFEALESANATLEERVKERTAELVSEKEKSELLLLNILPRKIVDQLKQSHEPIAKNFEEVSVLFADLVGFTALASEHSAAYIVGLLNQLFCQFDDLAERHQLEKIKTIGDAYMIAAGLPEERADHADAIARMAFGMLDVVQRFSHQSQLNLNLRIGINSGMVVGGVIGSKKFIYDLWGDTVNVASRMESSGSPSRIQVSETTYRKLKPLGYCLEARGEIEIKGKGAMATYWLLGLPSEATDFLVSGKSQELELLERVRPKI